MQQTQTPPIIVETIAIQAPIAAVFAAVTQPDQLVQWWGSEDGYQTATMEADLRPGGAWITTGKSRDGSTFSVSGVYRIVEPPRLLEFTWRHDWRDGDEVADTVVRYDLEERDGVTEFRVTHSGFTSSADREDHAQGWKTVLGWLRDYLTRNAE